MFHSPTNIFSLAAENRLTECVLRNIQLSLLKTYCCVCQRLCNRHSDVGLHNFCLYIIIVIIICLYGFFMYKMGVFSPQAHYSLSKNVQKSSVVFYGKEHSISV